MPNAVLGTKSKCYLAEWYSNSELNISIFGADEFKNI